MQHGVLSIQELRELLASKAIAAGELAADQLQPNSLDLRVGSQAYCVRYSFLPTDSTVAELLEQRDLIIQVLDLEQPNGAILETGKIYIIPLQESLRLPPHLSAAANPKSSTGRLDILARLMVDRFSMFDGVPAGYTGPLYLEVVPRSFPIRMRRGDRLAQLRLFHGSGGRLSDSELREVVDQFQLIRTKDGQPLPANQLVVDDGICLTVNLQASSSAGRQPIGYVARKCAPVVDLSRQTHPLPPYWQEIQLPKNDHSLILQSDEFYIFASRERIIVPPHLCAEMLPYDSRSGELRAHYAGFADSGFGQPNGAHIVLEVRNLDVPFLLQDGQRLFKLHYYRNSHVPEQLYGQVIGSNYQGQALRLSKHFAQ